MAVAFSEKERTEIQRALKAEARRCAVSMGVRKTTVDQLAAAADISKGAFYRFYESKERLFFELLEDIHRETYQAAAKALQENTAGSPAERAESAILAACDYLDKSGMMGFMERDVPHILRKVPEDVLSEHYHGDEVHIRELLEGAALIPAGGMPLAAATVRGLMLTVSHREDIGTLYPQVLETLVHGACQRLFPT